VTQRKDQALARPKLVQDFVKATKDVPRFGIGLAGWGIRQLFGFEEGEPAAGSLATEIPLQDSDRKRNDEAAQGLRLAKGLHAGEQPIEHLLRDVLGFVLVAQRAAGHVEDQRRESVPGRRVGPRLAAMSARARSASSASGP